MTNAGSFADVVALTTNHSAFDIDFIQEHSQMIVACPVKLPQVVFHKDMRNMIKEANDKVYKP
ncbi:MAG: hypothetical protein K9G70_07665 [Prolixibacteraceae bacterium]|nr:hypothetical protein [Prolixibacteraceae bacterium]